MMENEIYCIKENGYSWYKNDGQIASGVNFLGQTKEWKPEWYGKYIRVDVPQHSKGNPY